MSSGRALDIFPEECAQLGIRFQNGEIDGSKYLSEFRNLNEEADREDLRQRLDSVLSGILPKKEETIEPDVDLDARIDAYLARKLPSAPFGAKESA